MADEEQKLRPSRQPTMRPARSAVVLVVGGPAELDAATTAVARGESPVIAVHACGVGEAPTLAATLRPFMIVISHDVFGFDPDGLTALARDVQAELTLMRVTGATGVFLEQAIRPSLRHTFRRFRTETESGPVRR